MEKKWDTVLFFCYSPKFVYVYRSLRDWYSRGMDGTPIKMEIKWKNIGEGARAFGK